MAAITAAGLCLGVFAAIPTFSQAAVEHHSHLFVASGRPIETQPSISPRPILANFLGEPASDDARQIADWVVYSGDNRGLPFVIVDKKDTKVFAFDGHGYLLGATPALLGLARGDDSAPGIGDRELSDIRPEERTTAAGRFVSALGRNLRGQEVLWVDYDAALTLHRVLARNTKEARLQRLAAASPLPRRITFGCINVPASFFDGVVHPAFTGTNGVVYILPEIKSIREVFFTSIS
ncbi:MAG TPA: hypothetical protein VGC27_01270 [Rhizomicrobium sp.]